MFKSFKSALTQSKDKTLSRVVKEAFNYKLKEYGEIVEFHLDSDAKTITLEVLLEGEVEALRVEVKSYEIIQEDEKHFLLVNDIITSRAWINTLVEKHLDRQKFQIPNEYVKILKLVV